jgi:hypothetical protein
VNVAHADSAAPEASYARIVRWRGPLAVLIAVALVLGVPSLAYATFTAKTTAAVTAGTYKVPAPASFNGSLVCTKSGDLTGATLTIKEFGKVDRATGYTGMLQAPDGATATMQVSSGSTVTVSTYGGEGTYTFTLTAKVGSWTGVPLERTVTC